MRALAWRDWYLLVTSCVLLPTVAGFFFLLGIRRTSLLMTRLIPAGETSSEITGDDVIYAKHVAYLVSAAANHGLYHANCLKQALVTQHLLARQGLLADMKVGVKLSNEPFHAHSWLELRGEPLVTEAGQFYPECTFRLEH
jgi:hypothetical protein